MRKGFGIVPVFLVVMIVLLFGAIHLPCLMRSKIASNEASATATLRSLRTLETPRPTTLIKNGYRFLYTPGEKAGTYTIQATPVTPGSSGVRTFFMDETGVIRVNGAPI